MHPKGYLYTLSLSENVSALSPAQSRSRHISTKFNSTLNVRESQHNFGLYNFDSNQVFYLSYQHHKKLGENYRGLIQKIGNL